MKNGVKVMNKRTVNYKWSLLKNFTNQLFSSSINRIIGLITIIGLVLLHYPHFHVIPIYLISAYVIIFFATFIKTVIEKKYRTLNEAEGLLLEHTYNINALSISKNANFLASCSGDQYAVVWDLSERKIKYRLPHAAWVGNVAISGDGRYLFSLSGKTDNLRQWDLSSASIPNGIPAHSGHSRGLALSEDGKLIVTCGPDGYIKIFDAIDIKNTIGSAKLSTCELRKVAISKNNKLIYAGNIKGSVYLYNTENGTISEIYTEPDKSMIRFVTFDSSNDFLAITDSNGLLTIITLSAATKITVKAHIGHAICAAFTPNNKFIATGGQDGVIRVWYIRKANIVKHLELTGHTNSITALLFGKNSRLYSAGRDSKIMIWNLNGLYNKS